MLLTVGTLMALCTPLVLCSCSYPCLVLHSQQFVLTWPIYILARLHSIWTQEWACYDQSVSCNNTFMSKWSSRLLQMQLSGWCVPVITAHLFLNWILPSHTARLNGLAVTSSYCRTWLTRSSWDSVQLWKTVRRQSDTKYEYTQL